MKPEQFDALEYTLAAIETIERLAYNSDRVDWRAVRAEASTNIQAGSNPEVVYGEIRSALDMLADGHSFLVPPVDGARIAASGQGPTEVRLDSAHVGYIRLDGFFGVNELAMNSYVGDLSSRIDALAHHDIAAWIVDLRHNGGGNMLPMLGGLASIVGTRNLGEFVDKHDRREPWNIHESVTIPSAKVSYLTAPAAVLIGEVTASSGEAVAIAFIGRSNSRLIGTPTKGLSSSNEMIRLADGALLLVMTSLFADRTGKLYGGQIHPDDIVADEKMVLEVARNWIANTAQSG